MQHSPDITVEAATLEAVTLVHARIAEFASQTYIADNFDRPDLNISAKNPYIILAKIGGVAAGYIIGYDRSDAPRTMHIWLNGTDPQYRGRGVFGALLGNLVEEALRRGHEKLTVKSDLEAFPAMIRRLEASGFEQTQRSGSSVRYQRHLQ